MRTHAFVHFNSVEDAEKARLELNGVKINAKYATNKISKPVRLCKYETKQNQVEIDIQCNLLVKNLPKDLSAHSLYNMFRQFGDIRSCKLVVDYLGNSKGYGYVGYYRVEDSERAKNELDERDINGKLLKVTTLLHGKRTEKRKNNIYVKHIPKDNFNDDNLKELFEKYGEIKSAIVVKDQNGNSKGFGFVCFNRPEDAEEAYNNMKDATIFKNLPPLYVNFAMKKSERQELLIKKREETFKQAQKMTVFVKIKDELSVV
jgi:polyadenylate-binding protein